MAIELTKGQEVELPITNFCVGCNWGSVVERSLMGLIRRTTDVDLDLSCMMFDANGTPIDHIYSPLFRFGERNIGVPNGKLTSRDGALHHTGDDQSGDRKDDDGADNEVITVDLNAISPTVNKIVFFLNLYNDGNYDGDFSGIPYAHIRMFQGQPNNPENVIAQYNIATRRECAGKRALILGQLQRRSNRWYFSAIGDAHPDPSIINTIARVIRSYNQ